MGKMFYITQAKVTQWKRYSAHSQTFQVPNLSNPVIFNEIKFKPYLMETDKLTTELMQLYYSIRTKYSLGGLFSRIAHLFHFRPIFWCSSLKDIRISINGNHVLCFCNLIFGFCTGTLLTARVELRCLPAFGKLTVGIVSDHMSPPKKYTHTNSDSW